MAAFFFSSVVIGAFVIDAVAIAWAGFVLSILWGWFAVPIFGLRPLSIPEALGVAIVIGAMTKPYVPSKEGDTGNLIAAAFIKPAFALLSGWIVLKFM